MTHILHIDTSGGRGIVAITTDGVPVVNLTNDQPRDHAASLHLMVERAVEQAELKLSQINAIAVCAGPGSYTGLRIGLATAKGYCYAWDIPLLLHNKLAILAWQILNRDTSIFPKTAVMIALKARVGEYFIACYSPEFHEILSPQLMDQTQLNDWILANGELLINIFSDESENEFIISNADNISHYPVENIDIKEWGILSNRDYNFGRYSELAHAVPFYLKEVYINKKL